MSPSSPVAVMRPDTVVTDALDRTPATNTSPLTPCGSSSRSPSGTSTLTLASTLSEPDSSVLRRPHRLVLDQQAAVVDVDLDGRAPQHLDLERTPPSSPDRRRDRHLAGDDADVELLDLRRSSRSSRSPS